MLRRTKLLIRSIAVAITLAAPTAHAVVGGAPDTTSLAVVAIRAEPPLCDPLAPPPTLVCTGTLVHERVVLTAAHCLDAAPVEVMVVTTDGATARVSRAVRHASLDGAVLLLDRPLAPAPLPLTTVDDTLIGGLVRVVGFGTDDAQATGTRHSGTARIEAVSPRLALVAAPAMTCAGDSGGPVLVNVASGEAIAGVTSTGDVACTTGTAVRADALTALVDEGVQDVGASPPAERGPISADVDYCTRTCAVDDDCPAATRCDAVTARCTLSGMSPATSAGSCDGCEGPCVTTDQGCRCWQQCAAPDRGCSAGGGRGGLALILLVALAFAGCSRSRATNQGICPDGTRSRGDAALGDRIVWCEKNGQKHGPFQEWYPTGTLKREGTFRAGKLEGRWRTFHPSGKPATEVTYVDGVMHGPTTSWDDAGNKVEEGTYERGVRVGRWRRYHPNGKLELETEWMEPGVTELRTIYHPDGSKYIEGSFKHGEKHGTFIEYFASGKVSTAGTYVDGLRKGTWTRYREDGSIERQEELDEQEKQPVFSDEEVTAEP